MQLNNIGEQLIYDYFKNALNCPQSECLEAVRRLRSSAAHQSNDEMQSEPLGVDGHSWLSVQGLELDKRNKCRDDYCTVVSKRVTHPQLVKSLVDQMALIQ